MAQDQMPLPAAAPRKAMQQKLRRGSVRNKGRRRTASARQPASWLPPVVHGRYSEGHAPGTQRASLWPNGVPRSRLGREEVHDSRAHDSNLASNSHTVHQPGPSTRGRRLTATLPVHRSWSDVDAAQVARALSALEQHAELRPPGMRQAHASRSARLLCHRVVLRAGQGEARPLTGTLLLASCLCAQMVHAVACLPQGRFSPVAHVLPLFHHSLPHHIGDRVGCHRLCLSHSHSLARFLPPLHSHRQLMLRRSHCWQLHTTQLAFVLSLVLDAAEVFPNSHWAAALLLFARGGLTVKE